MVETTFSRNSIIRFLVIGTAIVVILFGLKWSEEIITTPLTAAFLTILVLPVLRLLQRRGMSARGATIVVLAATLLLIVVLIGLLAYSVLQLAASLPEYQAELAARFQGIKDTLAAAGVQTSDIYSGNPPSLSIVLQWVIRFVGGLITPLAYSVIMLIIFVYAVIEAGDFGVRFIEGLGADNQSLVRLRTYADRLGTFMGRQAILGAGAAALQTLFLWIIGIDFVILWGVLSFLFSFVPNIGFWLAVIPVMVLAFLQYGVWMAVVVLVGYTVINSIFDTFIYPRFMGEGLDVSPTVVLTMVFVWGWLLGGVGALLALPLTMLVKMVILEAYPDSRWLAHVISAKKAPPPAAAEAAEPALEQGN